MNRQVVLFAVLIAALALLLKLVEYRFWVRDLTLELYLGIIAACFLGLGLWLGGYFRKKKAKVTTASEEQPPSSPTLQAPEELGISPREFEILQLIEQGYSNQEIADQLFVSLSTVKTHVSNLFAKLDVKRRTQAIQRAKELELL